MVTARDASMLIAGATSAMLVAYAVHKYQRIMPRRVDEQSHGRVHSIDSATLQAFVERVFVASDVSVEDAKTAASILVLADLRGIDSYGFPP
jgi:hypothetical protein